MTSKTTVSIPVWARATLALAVFATILGVIFFGTGVFQTLPQDAEEAVVNATPRERADHSFENRQWSNASVHYQQLLDQDKFNPRAWYRYGYSLQQLQEYDAAINAYQQAMQFGEVEGFSRYNLACVYALAGRPDEAIEVLKESVQTGFVTRRGMRNDRDFESLRDDPEFLRLAMLEDRMRRRR